MYLQITCAVIKCLENKHKMWYFVFETENLGREISGREKTQKYIEKINRDPRRREEILREQCRKETQ